jgi:hypothetical protein
LGGTVFFIPSKSEKRFASGNSNFGLRRLKQKQESVVHADGNGQREADGRRLGVAIFFGHFMREAKISQCRIPSHF